MIDELLARLSNLEKRFENLSRIAQVAAVHEETGLVDVAFEGHSLKEIPFMTMRAGEDMTYWLPSVGELGELRAPSGDLGNAFFVPGIFYSGFPIPEGTANLIKRIFRDDQVEEIDTDAHSYKYTSGDSVRFIDRTKIEDKKGTSTITQDDNQTEIKRTTGKVKEVVGTNMNELTTILLNLLGAHFFPTGITTLQSPTGPVFFAPAASPAAAPTPPAGSSPNSEGKVTKTPASRINSIAVHGSNLTMSFTLPAIPVTVAGSAGTTTPTPLTLRFNLSSGTVDLTFPARSL